LTKSGTAETYLSCST